MTIITGLTAARMLEIEAASVVDGSISGDNLILTKHDGSTIDAGNVRGIQGLPGPIGRNRIINGDFSINQRGQMAAILVHGGFVADRWILECGAASNSLIRVENTPLDFPDIFSHFVRLTTSSHATSSQYAALVQKIENVRTFSEQTITVSFWARASSGTPSVAVELERYFGSLGSTTSHTIVGKTVLSTSPQRYSFTVTVPSLTNKTINTNGLNDDRLSVRIFVSAGSDFNARTNSLGLQNTTIDITGVQIEEGAVATAFDYRSYVENLLQCQRYYYRSLLYGTELIFPSHASGVTATWLIPHPVPLRKRGTAISSFVGIVYNLAQGANWAAIALSTGRLVVGSTAISLNCTATFGVNDYIGVDAEF